MKNIILLIFSLLVVFLLVFYDSFFNDQKIKEIVMIGNPNYVNNKKISSTLNKLICQKLYQVSQEGEPLSGLFDYEAMKSEISKAVKNSGKTKVRIAGEKTAYYDAVFQVLILAQSQEWQPVLAFDK